MMKFGFVLSQVSEARSIDFAQDRLWGTRRLDSLGSKKIGWFFGYLVTGAMAVDRPPVATPVVPALVRVPSLLTAKMEAALCSLVT
jgi:hypothetical protein